MSKLGFDTTADEAAVVFHDQIVGKVVLVTGASPGGLGAVAARSIARHQPKLVILAGRSQTKLDEAAQSIRSEVPEAALRTLVFDLGAPSSVKTAAKEVLAYEEDIDVLINNAGVMTMPYTELSETGWEAQLGGNHLGHALFTALILAKLAKPARVVNVSSWGHNMSPMHWDDLFFSKGATYDKWQAYGQSKTANILFSVALNDKYASRELSSVALHPGAIKTPLVRHVTDEEMIAFGLLNEDGTPNAAFDWKEPSNGAATHIVAGFTPDLGSEIYYVDCQKSSELPKDYKPGTLAPHATGLEDARRLLKLTEELTGVTFPNA